MVGNLEEDFVKSRQAGLDKFLKDLAKKPFIWYSEEVKIFLKKSSDLEKQFNALPKLTYLDLIASYRKLCSEKLSADQYGYDYNEKI